MALHQEESKGLGSGFAACRCWLSSWLRHGFRPAGRVPFGIAPKGTKRSSPRHPASPAARFPHSIIAPGAGVQGPSWPFTPLAASMRLAPFHNDSVRPPEGSVRRCLKLRCTNPSPAGGRGQGEGGAGQPLTPTLSPAGRGSRAIKSARTQQPPSHQATRSPSPRQEAEWRCCAGGRAARMAARGITGQGWPVYAGPRSGTGGREVSRSETRMSGCLSLWLLSLGHARGTQRSGVTAAGWPEGRAKRVK